MGKHFQEKEQDQIKAELFSIGRGNKSDAFRFSIQDVIKSAGMILLASAIGYGFWKMGLSASNIIMVYILGVLITSIITTHPFYSIITSFVSVIVFNFLFTDPRFTLLAYDKDYPITFGTMFVAAFLTGSLAFRLKQQAKLSAQSAYRTRILFETNQMLEKVKGQDGIVSVTAKQLMKLLNRDVVIYIAEREELGEAKIFAVNSDTEGLADLFADGTEYAAARWVLRNNKHAGAGTEMLSEARGRYLSIRSGETVYGVIGIHIEGNPLDSFENSVLLSILGECALALENEKNAREKAEAALIAEKEQLRANLLRSISHDLRTPLTAICGNASNLMSNDVCFDEETKQHLYSDIYDDSMWLYNLVENLLSVTRIEEGNLNIHPTTELLDEIITEALLHINRKKTEHEITVYCEEEFVLVKADTRLIMQVIINIVDNAIKYTQKGSKIRITTEKSGDRAVVHIADNGPGISEETKSHVFDMFYSGAKTLADSRRSMGLGLALCKSIIDAHGGELQVTDNVPHGTVFSFSLQTEEVKLYE